jgi:cell division protein FtsI (penicillin-binding protein 3)
MSYLQPGDPAKRLRLFILAIVVIALLFIGRLVQVQIIQADSINKQSLSSRSVTHTIPAIRGQILDATGRVLARTVLKYDVNVAPINVKPQTKKVNGVLVEVPVEQLVAQMAGILGLTPQEVSAKIAGTGQYANVAKGVDANVYDQLKKLEIDWVYFDAHPSRTYPSGALAGSLLGFLSDGKPMGGIESLYNSCLTGVDGKETYEKGEDGIKIPDSVVTTTKAVNGRDVHLTINADLQYFAQQVLTQKWASLKADWATAVVIEVKTGRILVAAEAPTMDPNDPAASSEASRHARVFESSFEPGSVIKTITAATLVDTGKATPATQVIAPYSWVVPGSNGYRVSDSHVHGNDKLTLTGVLRDSSNTGIMKLGAAVNAQTRFSYLTKFGMGKKTSLKFPGEASGFVLPFDQWDGVKKYVSMFGQGFSVTPLQSAMMYQAIGNKGVLLQPRLVEGCDDRSGNIQTLPMQPGKRAVSESTARTTIDMLEKVVEQGGIGRHAAVAGYRVGGKTGTAQITDPNTGKYGNLHAISFIGMAPAENPEYVVAVTAYKSRTITNSIGATPIFKAIMQQVLRTYRVAPSTTKSATIPTVWK